MTINYCQSYNKIITKEGLSMLYATKITTNIKGIPFT